jgi:hypothetical protein
MVFFGSLSVLLNNHNIHFPLEIEFASYLTLHTNKEIEWSRCSTTATLLQPKATTICIMHFVCISNQFWWGLVCPSHTISSPLNPQN